MANDIASSFGHVAPLMIGAALLVFAALHDIAARTIPNLVSILLALLGLAVRVADGQLIPALVLGLFMFVVCTACWLRGWMGGGDVKLLTAAAVFVPPAAVGNMVIATTLAGGVVGIIYLAARTYVRHAHVVPGPAREAFIARVLRAEIWRLLRGAPLPYASAIAAGTLFVTVSG